MLIEATEQYLEDKGLCEVDWEEAMDKVGAAPQPPRKTRGGVPVLGPPHRTLSDINAKSPPRETPFFLRFPSPLRWPSLSPGDDSLLAIGRGWIL